MSNTKPDSSQVKYIPAGVGAVAATVQRKMLEIVSVADFKNAADPDDTNSFNRAVLHLALRGGGKLITPAPSYSVANKVFFTSNVEIDLCKTVITGSLTSTLFESAYLSGGVLVTNVGTANESHTLHNIKIHNGTINNSLLAFNVFNFLSNCEVSDIRFNHCNKCAYASRSFYSSWKNLTSNNEGGLQYAGVPAFTFYDNVNAMTIKSISVGHRDTGIYLRGPVFQTVIDNCQLENGVTGIIVENETFALEIRNCYFESISGKSIDLTYAAQKTNLVIDNNFFHGTGIGVQGQLLIDGEIGAGNTFTGNSSNVIITDDNYSSITVYIPTNGDSNIAGFLPALPTEYTLGRKVHVIGSSYIYNNASGALMIRAQMTNGPSGLVDLLYSGDCGMVDGKIPFCTHVSSTPGATNFNVLIDTKIFYSPYTMIMFAVQISDGMGVKMFSGRIYGLTVFLDGTGDGRTASANYSNGYVQLQLNGFVSVGGAYGAEGIVRIV